MDGAAPAGDSPRGEAGRLRRVCAPLARLTRLVFRLDRYWLLSQPLKAVPPAPDPLSAGVEIEETTAFSPLASSLVESRYAPPRGDPRKQTARARGRLRRGDRLYVFHQGDEPLGWVWSTRRGYMVDVLESLALRPGEVVLYDAYILDRARGRGLYPICLGRVLLREALNGARLASVLVGGGNRASLLAHMKAGFQVIRLEVTRVRLFAWEKSRWMWGPFPLDYELNRRWSALAAFFSVFRPPGAKGFRAAKRG